jgi:hypothetical protein
MAFSTTLYFVVLPPKNTISCGVFDRKTAYIGASAVRLLPDLGNKNRAKNRLETWLEIAGSSPVKSRVNFKKCKEKKLLDALKLH